MTQTNDLYTLAQYDITRRYGGPEEGGWYYDEGELVSIIGTYETRHAALEARAGLLLDYEKGSLRVYEGTPPAHFPETRPHYE